MLWWNRWKITRINLNGAAPITFVTAAMLSPRLWRTPSSIPKKMFSIHSGTLAYSARRAMEWMVISNLAEQSGISWIARLLCLMAQDEDRRFNLLKGERDHRVAVGLDDRGYLDYVMWTARSMPVLVASFVLRNRQRAGLGGQMVRYWAERLRFHLSGNLASKTRPEGIGLC